MRPVWIPQSASAFRQNYIDNNKQLYHDLEADLALDDSSLAFDDVQLTVTDRLHRLITCGKQIRSLEVVTIYNAWEDSKEEPSRRAPIYLVHFAGLSNETASGLDLCGWFTNSYLLNELNLRANSRACLPHLHDEERCFSAYFDYMAPEITYNVFMRLERGGTEFRDICMPRNSVDGEQIDQLASATDLRDQRTSYPVPCFSTKDSGARLILYGYLGSDSDKMQSKLQKIWQREKRDSKKAAGEYDSMHQFIKAHPFFFVEDSCFSDRNCTMTKDWRLKKPLKEAWVKGLTDVYRSDTVGKLGSSKTYGELLEAALQVETT